MDNRPANTDLAVLDSHVSNEILVSSSSMDVFPYNPPFGMIDNNMNHLKLATMVQKKPNCQAHEFATVYTNKAQNANLDI